MRPFDFDEVQWFCVRTAPRQEQVVAAHLQRLTAVEVFSPRVRFRRGTRTGGAQWITEALFPGYVFVRCRLSVDYRNVRYAHGVRGFVEFGERVATMGEETIAELRDRVGLEPVQELTSALAPGSEVRVVAGAFRGLTATVTQLRSSTERVRILLEFLGREVEAEVATSHVLAPTQHPLAA